MMRSTATVVAALGIGTAAGLAALGPGLITQRLSGPRMRVVRAGEGHLRVAACRVRFPTSVAAQIYYPTASTAAECGRSYPYFRPGVLAALADALGQPAWLFSMFGLGGTVSPALTRTLEGGAPPPIPPAIAAGLGASGKGSGSGDDVGGVGEGRLPVVLLSPGLYAHCDLHAALSMELARRGHVVVVLEHEDGSASFCHCKRTGSLLTYVVPPAAPAGGPDPEGYDELLGRIRAFRGPGLKHREREIADVVASLRAGTAYALDGDTGLPFAGGTGGGGGGDAAASVQAQAQLGRLMARLDTSQFVMAGHSFGATTAITAVQSAHPLLAGAFRACLLFDPWTEPLESPALAKGFGALPTFALVSGGWVGNNFFHLTKQLFEPRVSSASVLAAIPDTGHQWVADSVHWFPGWLGRAVKIVGAQCPGRALQATVAASVELLDGRDVASFLRASSAESTSDSVTGGGDTADPDLCGMWLVDGPAAAATASKL